MTKLLQIDGLPIIDATRPISLNITKADITKAHTKAPNACAIARACARQLHVKEARVHLGRIYLRTNDSNWVRYQTGGPLRNEIIAFDRGGTFEPGEYRMAPVTPTHQVRAHQGGPEAPGSRNRSRKTTKPRAPRHIVTDVRGGPA